MSGYRYDSHGILHKYGAFYDEYCDVFKNKQSVDIEARTKKEKNKKMTKHELENKNFKKFAYGITSVLNDQYKDEYEKERLKALETVYAKDTYKQLVSIRQEINMLYSEYENIPSWRTQRLAAVRNKGWELQRKIVEIAQSENLACSYGFSHYWNSINFVDDILYEFRRGATRELTITQKYVSQDIVSSVLMTLDWENMEYKEIVKAVREAIQKS